MSTTVTTQASSANAPDFFNSLLVADENLRARVAEKTEGVRNVILALAFGSLAASQKDVV